MPKHIKLTDEMESSIIKLLSQGNYIETSCRVAGIHRRTFYSWLERAEQEDPEYDNSRYKAFRDNVLQAIALAEVELLKMARKGSREALPIMERRWPERWGRWERQSVEVTGKDGGPIKYQAEDLSDDELAAVIAGRSSRRATAPAGGPQSSH